MISLEDTLNYSPNEAFQKLSLKYQVEAAIVFKVQHDSGLQEDYHNFFLNT